MKTIEQLLQLSKNPYYRFTNDEKAILDDFLEKRREEVSTSSTKKKESNSGSSTPVRVRNIVTKTILQPEDAPEPSERR